MKESGKIFAAPTYFFLFNMIVLLVVGLARMIFGHLAGRVRSLRVQPWADIATLECTLVDDSGGITVVFLGRRKIPGVTLGRRMVVAGMAGAHHKLALLNPDYTLLSS